jgi:hypothetical protein
VHRFFAGLPNAELMGASNLGRRDERIRVEAADPRDEPFADLVQGHAQVLQFRHPCLRRVVGRFRRDERVDVSADLARAFFDAVEPRDDVVEHRDRLLVDVRRLWLANAFAVECFVQLAHGCGERVESPRELR